MFNEDLFLTNATGRELYHAYAEPMPIIDYHCHLPARAIYENKEFEDLGDMWLSGDHYKWRVMRTFGIDEKYITGKETSYHEKYLKFAEILPYLAGNPIYVWCMLELKRFFDIDDMVTEENAEEIYMRTRQLIHERHMTPQWCMEHCHVEFVSTTEDPVDMLEYHHKLREEKSCKVQVVSAFRPDQAMYCENKPFSSYIKKLSEVSGIEVHSFNSLLEALEKRLVYFASIGTSISDCGLEDLQFYDSSREEAETVFQKAMQGRILTTEEINIYRSRFIIEMGRIYYRHQFIMQLHVGTSQDTNHSRVKQIGRSCGFDCIDDTTSIRAIAGILDTLTASEELPRTILYPLDASQMENYAVLAAGFCEGPQRAKVQLGAPWWFHDQPYGIQRQFQAAANLYPVSLSVGMLTDSRSFLSYPRHELYRRQFCDYLGMLVERGEYPRNEKYLKKIIQDVCYNNVKAFLGIS